MVAHAEQANTTQQHSEFSQAENLYAGIDKEIAMVLRQVDGRVLPQIHSPLPPLAVMYRLQAQIDLGKNDMYPQFVKEIASAAVREELVPLHSSPSSAEPVVDEVGVRLLAALGRVRDLWYRDEEVLDIRAIVTDTADALGTSALGDLFRAHNGIEQTMEVFSAESSSRLLDPRADSPLEERFKDVFHEGMRNYLTLFEKEEMGDIQEWPVSASFAREIIEAFSGLDPKDIEKFLQGIITNNSMVFAHLHTYARDKYAFSHEELRAFVALSYGLKRLVEDRNLPVLPVRNAIYLTRKMLGEDVLIDILEEPVFARVAPLIQNQYKAVERELAGAGYHEHYRESLGISPVVETLVTEIMETNLEGHRYPLTNKEILAMLRIGYDPEKG